MQLIRGLHNLRDGHRPCVATIGNFDGVHLGHEAVIERLRERSVETGLPSTVMVFEPQPREFFQGEAAPARLSTFAEKWRRIAALGVDRVLCLQFNERLRSLSADAFIQRVLVDGIGVRHLAVGDDFRFGCDRRGDYPLLQAAGREQGFTVEATASFRVAGERVSSTRVRLALEAGDLAAAGALLGRPYSIFGRVGLGDQRGRTMGVPTANILLKRHKVPLRGVFVVRVAGATGQDLDGIANVGLRPTVDGVRPSLEAHLFDFDAEIYGRKLEVTFLHRLREERRFGDLDSLRDQIMLDIGQARDWLSAGAA